MRQFIFLLTILCASLSFSATRSLQGDSWYSNDLLKLWTPPGVSDTLLGVSATQSAGSKTFFSSTWNGGSIVSATFSGTLTGGVYTGTVSGTVNILDNLLTFQDNSTPTKKGQFNTSGVTAGQTRILDFPDDNGVLACVSCTQNFSNKTFTNPVLSGTMSGGVFTGTASGTGVFLDNLLTLQDDATPTRKGQFNVSSVSPNTTRIYSLPDIDGTVAVLNQIQTFSASQTFTQGVTLSNGQLVFPSSQVPSSNANTLDDYEEGTCTPTYQGTSTSGTATYSVQRCDYTKIGSRVIADIYISWTTIAGGIAGGAAIGGLPFPSTSVSANYRSACSISYADGISMTAGNALGANIGPGVSHVTLYQMPVSGTTTAVPVDGTGLLMMNCSYMSAN